MLPRVEPRRAGSVLQPLWGTVPLLPCQAQASPALGGGRGRCRGGLSCPLRVWLLPQALGALGRWGQELQGPARWSHPLGQGPCFPGLGQAVYSCLNFSHSWVLLGWARGFLCPALVGEERLRVALWLSHGLSCRSSAAVVAFPQSAAVPSNSHHSGTPVAPGSHTCLRCTIHDTRQSLPPTTALLTLPGGSFNTQTAAPCGQRGLGAAVGSPGCQVSLAVLSGGRHQDGVGVQDGYQGGHPIKRRGKR